MKANAISHFHRRLPRDLRFGPVLLALLLAGCRDAPRPEAAPARKESAISIEASPAAARAITDETTAAAVPPAFDAESAGAKLAGIPEPEARRLFLSELMEREFKVDPRGAAAFALSLFDEGEATETLLSLIRLWAARDAEEALGYLYELGDSLSRTTAVIETGRMLTATDPIAAMDIAHDFPEGPDRDYCAGQVMQAWAMRDGAAAARWLAQQPSESQLPELEVALAGGWARVAPAQAAQFVSNQLPPGPNQTRAAAAVAVVWAKEDAPSAGDWSLTFPKGEIQNGMLRVVLSYWKAQNQPEMERWISALDPDAAHTVRPLLQR